MSFAENLQYLRKKKRITQEELADELQVSRQSVSKWETGEAYPETEKLIALCDKFDVTLDDLMRGDVRKPKQESIPVCEPDRQSSDEPAPIDADKEKKAGLMNTLGNSFGGLIMLSCAAAYLCMGFLANLWHPGWLVFLGGITFCIVIGGIFGNDGGKEEHEHHLHGQELDLNFKARLFGAFAGASMMAAVTVYLCLGFLCGLWHPGWVVFLAGGALAGIFGGLAKYFGEK